MWVVLFHTFQGSGTSIRIIDMGYAGVDLFFVLSGFVLSHVYFDDRQISTLAGYSRFLGVRLARIYPLHLVALCCLGIIVLVLPGFADAYPAAQQRFGSGAFIANLFLVQNW